MLIASFPAGAWQANCYLLAPAENGPAVVVDPGVDAAQGVRAGLQQYGLTLEAVLLTHGHIDHMASAREVADEAGVPVWVHEADNDLLSHPTRALGEFGVQFMQQNYGSTTFEPPHEVCHYDDSFTAAGIRFDTLHAPGHTPGCTLLLPQLEEARLALCGDVVFAGSVGRTDLPRGDAAEMARTLQHVVLGLDDELHLLPGHGPATTMAAERVGNLWLRPEALAQMAASRP